MPLAALALTLSSVLPGPQGYLRHHLDADAALVARDGPEARAGFERCLELSPRNPTVAYGLACATLLEGDRQAALEWLERAVEWGYADAALALWDEDLAGLRAEPGFRAALDRMRGDGASHPFQGLVAIQDSLAKSMITAVAIDREARVVAQVETGGCIRLLDARTGAQLRVSPELGSPLWSVDFHPDGRSLAALANDGRAFFFGVGGEEAPRAIEALPPAPEEHPNWCFGTLIEFDPTGARLFVAAWERGASLWTSDGKLVRRWDEPLANTFAVPVAWSPDGKQLAAATKQGVRFFDAEDGAERASPITCTSPPRALHYQPDGTHLATGHADGRARLWELPAGKLIWTGPEPVDQGFGPNPVGCVQFSPDGRWLALTTTGVEGDLLETKGGTRVWTSGFLGGRMGETAPARWSPDSKRLWYAFASGVMDLYEHELELGAAKVLTCARPPVVSPAGIAVTASWRGVAALDALTGRFLWHRPALDGERELLQAPQGWFTLSGSSEDLAGCELVLPGDDQRTLALESRAHALLDPKRVRAARAGIALVPLEL